MPPLRRSIRMSPDEDNSLRRLYLEFRIPSDQYAKRPGDLERFMRRWNEISDRGDTAEDVMHYIKTKRKKGRWVRFDGDHELAPAPECLTPEQWEALDATYSVICVSNGLGSDNLDFDAELADEFRREFVCRTGLFRSGRDLLALLMVVRKDGRLQKINPDTPSRGFGFGDIDEVAG